MCRVDSWLAKLHCYQASQAFGFFFLTLGWVLFLSLTSCSTFMHQGDDGALQKAIALVLQNREDFVAILFYASWCPFSKIFRTDFLKLSSFFPTIAHFSFEESHIKPRCVFLEEKMLWHRLGLTNFWHTSHVVYKLQSIVKIWSQCLPNSFPCELYNACALSWISNHEFPCYVL